MKLRTFESFQSFKVMRHCYFKAIINYKCHNQSIYYRRGIRFYFLCQSKQKSPISSYDNAMKMKTYLFHKCVITSIISYKLLAISIEREAEDLTDLIADGERNVGHHTLFYSSWNCIIKLEKRVSFSLQCFCDISRRYLKYQAEIGNI